VTCGGVHVIRSSIDALYNAHNAVVDAAATDAITADVKKDAIDRFLTLMELAVEILREITTGSDAVSDDVSADPNLPWMLLWLTDKRGYRPLVASMLEEVAVPALPRPPRHCSQRLVCSVSCWRGHG
jgi:hypothetical protein